MKTYKQKIKELSAKSQDVSSNPFAQKLKDKNAAKKNMEHGRKVKTAERLANHA